MLTDSGEATSTTLNRSVAGQRMQIIEMRMLRSMRGERESP